MRVQAGAHCRHFASKTLSCHQHRRLLAVTTPFSAGSAFTGPKQQAVFGHHAMAIDCTALYTAAWCKHAVSQHVRLHVGFGGCAIV